jgi:hypothetical protein
MAITYTQAINSIRTSLQISTTSDVTLSDSSLLERLNEVYAQWWRMLYDHPTALTSAESTAAGITASQWRTDITGADLVSINSVYASTSSTANIGSSGTFPLEKVSPEEMGYLHRSYATSTSAGAGFPETPANGIPQFYSVELTQNGGLWSLWVYPRCSSTHYFPMLVRKPPTALAYGSFNYVCLDDEMVAICAVTALRMLANIGRQNDQGLIQMIATAIPQEMQSMAFSPKTENMK